jgi:hypothetical protein
MKVLCVGLIALASYSTAFGLGASVTAGSAYNWLYDNTAIKAGLSLSQPIRPGFGYWSWYGLGVNAQDQSWASMTQAIDWSVNSATTSFTYKLSKDPDKFMDKTTPFEQEVGIQIKFKLLD